MPSLSDPPSASAPRVARVGACYCLHDETDYLAVSMASLLSVPVPPARFAFVSRVPWHHKPGDWEAAKAVAEAAGASVVVGDWATEQEQRQAACDHLKEQGFTHALITDGDEVIEPSLLSALLCVAASGLAERVYVSWDTYWKSPEYVIRPRERFTPCYLVDVAAVTPTGGRNFEGGRPLFLGHEFGIVHHLSWVGPERRIRRKLSTWGHATEVQPGWFERVWCAWDREKRLGNLHPTHPDAYGFAERIHVPEILAPAFARCRELSKAEGKGTALWELPSLDKPRSYPSVSVVIPVHGGSDDLTACLDSLAPLVEEKLLAEVIVVDNASPDDAATVASGYPFVQLLQNETNTGFAHASNLGAERATGEMLLFLNSDTIVPRVGLLRLVECLKRSGSIGAAGPVTNRAGHGQQIAVTYTSLSTMPLFAQDFACRDAADEDVDMLVGFCLLVRRSVWDEVKEGEQGFDERFGLGTFEDNDLCYRIRRAGYRLVKASKSFIHHAGSKTLVKVAPDVGSLLARNEGLYRRKWQEDMETGFASHLSGLAGERIVFDPERHPDLRLTKMRQLSQEADISLVMIVKNEERVLGEALESAKPFFAEMIVVDTGSTDRTVAIAEAAGAKVFHFPWTDSFSEARNESLSHASGRWVFWMDADDTLRWEAGSGLVEMALSAPEGIAAFIVPVQFVDDGTGANVGGTRVDHVKLFRNLPGLAFEGRIHEQILPSLRQVAGDSCGIARAPESVLVLHSGYDTSAEGQARKRERDYKLLKLDLAERPDHPFVLFNLGMTDHYGGVHDQAVEWLRKCIAASQANESHVRKAYSLLAVSLRELGQTEAALAAIEEGLAKVGEDPELRFHAGYILSAAGRFAEARDSCEKVVGADISGHFSSIDMSILGYKTMHNLGSVCRAMSDYEAAKGWWLKALNDAPAFLPSAFDLFGAAIEVRDWQAAQRMLAHVEDQQGKSESWAAMGFQWAEAKEGSGAGFSWLESLWRDGQGTPAEIPARLVLSRKLLEIGQEAIAFPHLVWLSERGVAEAAYFLGVAATRRGNVPEALAWMERSLQLNPDHAETLRQIEALQKALSEGT